MSEQKQPWVIRGLLGVASLAMWLLSFGFVRRWLMGKIDRTKGKIVVEGKIVS